MSKNSSATDLLYMSRALELAQRGVGLTNPNPRVGAVIVRSGKIIGEGFHLKAGEAHAEVNAIADAKKRGEKIAGATLYVTLEPCCTHGRTPPCTDAIQREKIKRVVVGAVDPNPRHAGHGLDILRRAGIAVTSGVLAKESAALNRDFNHWITTRTPWVVAKIAMSLDGRIMPRKGRWLTGAKARRVAHELRWESDAIMVGAETVRVDNPQLTVRLPGRKGKVQPWRVVLTRSGKLPRRSAHLFTDTFKERTLVFQSVPLKRVLRDLGKRGVTNLLLEGGGKLLGEAFAAGAVNEIAFFIAPQIVGQGPVAIVLPRGKKWEASVVPGSLTVEKVGFDALVRGLVKGKS